MHTLTVDIDHDFADKITFESLRDTRERFLEDLGAGNSVFWWDDPEADDAEIQRHINALDIVIKWYGTPEQIKEIYG